jgi:hypothetical protein
MSSLTNPTASAQVFNLRAKPKRPRRHAVETRRAAELAIGRAAWAVIRGRSGAPSTGNPKQRLSPAAFGRRAVSGLPSGVARDE